MACIPGNSISVCMASGSSGATCPSPPPHPYYQEALRRLSAPYEQAKQAADRLQQQAGAALAAFGLPREIAVWIRNDEEDREYPPETWQALCQDDTDLWNDLADAGCQEREAKAALDQFLQDNDTGTPREPWELTLDAYIGDPKVYNCLPWNPEYHLVGAEKIIEHTFRLIRPGYAVARILNEGRSVVLLKEQFGQWAPVGAYRGIDLGILPAEQGKWLSAELIWEKGRANGGAPVGGGYSPAGLQAHRAAHRIAVERAFERGLIAPDSPLAQRHFQDYPHLKDRFGRSAAPILKKG